MARPTANDLVNEIIRLDPTLDVPSLSEVHNLDLEEILRRKGGDPDAIVPSRPSPTPSGTPPTVTTTVTTPTPIPPPPTPPPVTPTVAATTTTTVSPPPLPVMPAIERGSLPDVARDQLEAARFTVLSPDLSIRDDTVPPGTVSKVEVVDTNSAQIFVAEAPRMRERILSRRKDIPMWKTILLILAIVLLALILGNWIRDSKDDGQLNLNPFDGVDYCGDLVFVNDRPCPPDDDSDSNGSLDPADLSTAPTATAQAQQTPTTTTVSFNDETREVVAFDTTFYHGGDTFGWNADVYEDEVLIVYGKEVTIDGKACPSNSLIAKSGPFEDKRVVVKDGFILIVKKSAQ